MKYRPGRVVVARMVASVLLIGFLLAQVPLHGAGKDRPDLTGRVVGESNQPVAGAIVAIYSAGPRVGTSIYCPTCYVDCSKRVKTDNKGEFKITGLDPSLIFRVYASADLFTPQFFDRTDPLNGPVRFELKPMDPEWTKPGHVLKGRVVDTDGNPLMGAVIEPFGMETTERRWWGRLEDVSQLAISDEHGEFKLVSKFKNYGLDLRIEGRGHAPKLFPLVKTSTRPVELVLEEGGYVKGVLLRDGKPMPHVELGLVQENRSPEQFLGEDNIATDEKGRFLFSNVAMGGAYFLYSKMQGMQNVAAAPQLRQQKLVFTSNEDGSILDLGRLSLEPSCRIRGRVVLSDGGPIPEGTRMFIGREEAWDSLNLELNPDGSFEVNGFPTGETASFGLRIKGYRLSTKNPGRQPTGGSAVVGRVDRDLDNFVIVLDKGNHAPTTGSSRDKWDQLQKLKQEPLQGAEE